MAAHFGGTRTPLAVAWLKSVKHDGKIRSQFYRVNDVVPTIYDVLNITPPEAVDGVKQATIDGISMLSALNDAQAPDNKSEQYFEVMGSRAFYKNGWIASVPGPRIPWVPGVDPSIKDWNPDNDTWELYDLNSDFSQAKDLAAQQPAKLAELVKGFDQAAQANQVYPVGGGLWSMVLHPEDAPHSAVTSFRYSQDVYGLPEAAAAQLGTRSNIVKIALENKVGSEGVLYAIGGFSGGLAVWLQGGKLHYEYNKFMIERTVLSTEVLPAGDIALEIESRKDGQAPAAWM